MSDTDQVQSDATTNGPASYTGEPISLSNNKASAEMQRVSLKDLREEKEGKAEREERLISALLKPLLDKDEKNKIEEAIKKRDLDINLDETIVLYKQYLDFKNTYEQVRIKRNNLQDRIRKEGLTEEIRQMGKVLHDEEMDVLSKLGQVERLVKEKALNIPNIVLPGVKEGKDETENEIIRRVGDPKNFQFQPRNHVELGEILDIIDIPRATKVSGARFAYLKNEAVLLELALIQLAFDMLTKEGFIPIIPPTLIKKDITELLGYWQNDDSNEYYMVNDVLNQNMYLIGTAEHSIVPLHRDEILDHSTLPLRYVAFSSAFRREAGAYGKDVKGIFRVHQFDKVEMVSFTRPEDSNKEHEYLLNLEEKLFQSLGIPYQVVKMCSGDLGAPAAKKYDLEAWIPSEGKYREVTSASTTTDFQSKRLNIRYREDDKTNYVHILNGTGFAIGRTIIAILENYQKEDGTVVIPEVLQKYTNFSEIRARSHFR